MLVIDSVQGLRALAALLVVVSHQISMAGAPEEYTWFIGELGVYLFFIISGFIMVTVCREEFGTTGAPARFLRRRLHRIAPLYWLVTLVYAAKLTVTGQQPEPVQLFKSLLFIPYPAAGGIFRPVYGLGWTLNYEMFFYVLFAVALCMRPALGLTLLSLLLAYLVWIGHLLAPGQIDWLMQALYFWTRPVILYFVLGMLFGAMYSPLSGAGLLYRGNAALTFFFCAAAMASFAAWVYVDTALKQITPLVCFLAFAASALQRPRPEGQRPDWVVAVGNASYSIYLTHSFLAGPARRIWYGLFAQQHALVLVVSITIGSIALGMLVYRYIERPLLAFHRLSTRTAATRSALGTANGRD